MTTLRVGTRGSELALWQTNWVCGRLRAVRPGVVIEQVTIKTHGDKARAQRFDADWPVGGFVGAIEQALVRKEIDFAVHSYKDIQTAPTEGLVIAAVPQREVAHDVLVTRRSTSLRDVTDGFRVGTSSPRRIAQFRRLADVNIVEIRGNVATRLKKLETESLDGVVLAAAGLKRLGLHPPHRIDLPTKRFVPAPAQGALAVQTRNGGEAGEIVSFLDHAATRRCVETERAFLREISAGCHVPVGALCVPVGDSFALHGQLFSEDHERLAEGMEEGADPQLLGKSLARRLLGELGRASLD